VVHTMKTALKISFLVFGICGIPRIIIALAWGMFSFDSFSELPRFFRYDLNALVLFSFAAVITSAIGVWIEKKA